jgi:hypothetical protein
MVHGLARQFGIALVLGYALSASAQERVVIPLIPAASWHLVSSEPMGVDAVHQFGGDPAIEREYGVNTIVVRKYHLGAKQAEVCFEEASDPSAAYGLLTFYRSEAMEPARGIGVAFTGPSGAAMARGRFYIRARPAPDSQITENDLRALLIYIGGTRHHDTASLPVPLPSSGLIPHSEKYLLGLEAARRLLPNFRTDLIGFSQGAEAQVGTYSVGRTRATVLALNYPTPQIARARFGAMESMLGINQNKGRDSIYGRRTGSVLILVLDASDSFAARKLMDQFQVSSEISWNEAAPQREKFIVDVVRMVLAILLLAFFISGLAVAGGVLIYLSRRVARKYFPESAWGDPEHDRLITLDLR